MEQKASMRGLLATITMAAASMAVAAQPWAMWTDFSGLSAETPLAPQGAFTQNGINPSDWRLSLNGGTVEGTTLRTGTGVAPAVSFNATLTTGYDASNTPLTVLAIVRGTPSTPVGRPFFHLTNGTTGVGVALKTFDATAGTATLTGCWGNAAWEHGTAASRVFPQANALTGTGAVCLALKTGAKPVEAAVVPVGETAVTWTSITGLQGTGISLTGCQLGNFMNAAANGMDYTLERLAIFHGSLTSEELLAFVNDNTLTFSTDAVCSAIPAGMTVIAAGGTVDLSGAALGEGVTLKADLSAYTRPTTTFRLPEGWSGAVTAEGELPFEDLSYDPDTGAIAETPTPTLPWQLTWMPMGDSITEGEQYMGHPESGDADSRGGYRYQLWKALEDAGQDTRAVGFRTGHCGTDEVTANPDWAWHCGLYGGRIKPIGNSGCQWFNVESALENAGYPDVITLMLGINDLSNASDADADIQKVFDAWSELVAKLADCRPKSQVVVATLLPVRPNNASAHRYGPFNDKMRAAAAAKTAPFDRANVTLVDVCRRAFNDAFDAACFKGDGVHPNETGSIRVANAFRTGFAEAIRRIQAAAPAIAHVHNGTAGKVCVRLTHALETAENATLALSGTDVRGEPLALTLTEGALDADDPHAVAFPTETAFLGGAYTATLSGTFRVKGAEDSAAPLTLEASGATVELLGSGAEANVKSAFLEGFRRLSTVTLGDNDNYNGNGPAAGAVEAGEAIADPITRVGYYLELKRPGKPAQFVWASMDAATFGNDPAKVGIPTSAGGTHKAIVERFSVFGNRGNFEKEVTEGRGIIEFTPYTWNGSDQPGYVNEAQGGKFGWNDTLSTSGGLYGCMQVARIREGAKGDWTDPAAEMLFAYNKFNVADATDLGIGSFSTHRNNSGSAYPAAVYDWTHFSTNVGYTQYLPSAYEVKKLEIWVEPAPVRTWAGAAEGTWDKTSTGIWAENAAFSDGNEVTFGALNEGATAAAVTVAEAMAPTALMVTANAFSFVGEGSVDPSAVNVSQGASATFAVPLGTVGEDGAATYDGLLSGPGAITFADTAPQTLSGPFDAPLAVAEGASLKVAALDGKTVSVAAGGALEYTYAANHTPASLSGITGEGTLTFTSSPTHWCSLPLASFAETLSVANNAGTGVSTSDGGLLLKMGDWGGKTLAFRNLSGSGDFRVDWGTSDAPATIAVTMTKDTEYSGKFVKPSSSPSQRLLGLTVSGAAGALTLSGNSDNLGTLTVADTGRVCLKAPGAWAGPLVIEAGGALELAGDIGKGSGATTIHGLLTGSGALNGTAAGGAITVGDGATLRPTGDLTLAPHNAAAVAFTGNATIEVGHGALLTPGGVTAADGATVSVTLAEGTTVSPEALPLKVFSNIGATEAAAFALAGDLAGKSYALEKDAEGALVVTTIRPPKPNASETDATDYTVEAAAGLAEANGGATPTAVVAYAGTPEHPLNAEQVSDALACFSGIATSDGNGTVTVAYAFGVTDLSATPEKVTVTIAVKDARAESGANARAADTVDFQSGVAFAVTDSEGQEVNVPLTDETSANAPKGTRVFSFPTPEKNFCFRVRVSRP